MSEIDKYRVVIEMTEHQAKSVLKRTNPEIFDPNEVVLLRRVDDATESILKLIGADLLRYSIRVDDK